MRRVLGLILVVLAIACFWGGCENDKAATQGKMVIAVSQTPLSLPFYVADKKGFFAEEGLQIQMVPYKGGHRSLQALVERKVDLCTCSDLPIMFQSFKGHSFKVLATFVSSNNDLKIITSKETGIIEGKDLKGRRIGVIMGGSSQYLLDNYLIFNELMPSEVIVKAINPEDMADSLVSGKVDVIVPWEPYGFDAAQKLKKDRRILPYSKAIYQETFNLVASKEFMVRGSDRAVKLLRALDKAVKFILEHEDEAKKIVMDSLGKKREFVEWIWHDLDFRLSLNQYLINILEGEARWAIENGLVEAERVPNYLNFIAAEYLKKVSPESTTIIDR